MNKIWKWKHFMMFIIFLIILAIKIHIAHDQNYDEKEMLQDLEYTENLISET
jgi:hypothetical protein